MAAQDEHLELTLSIFFSQRDQRVGPGRGQWETALQTEFPPSPHAVWDGAGAHTPDGSFGVANCLLGHLGSPHNPADMQRAPPVKWAQSNLQKCN